MSIGWAGDNEFDPLIYDWESAAMPRTMEGIGTKYYGERDRAPDGTYVTTQFVCLLYVPLVPIGSFRVLPLGETTGDFFNRTGDYQVKRVPLNWRQVFNVYLGAACVVLVIIAAFGVFSYITEWEFRDQFHRRWFN